MFIAIFPAPRKAFGIGQVPNKHLLSGSRVREWMKEEWVAIGKHPQTECSTMSQERDSLGKGLVHTVWTGLHPLAPSQGLSVVERLVNNPKGAPCKDGVHPTVKAAKPNQASS